MASEIDSAESWKNAEERLRKLFVEGLPQLDARLRRRTIDRVVRRALGELNPGAWPTPHLVDVLARFVESEVADLERVERGSSALLIAYQGAGDEAERREILVRFLRSQNSSNRELRADIDATERWLDIEAMQERASSEIADKLDAIEVAYRVMGHVVSSAASSPNLALQISETGAPALATDHARPERRHVIRIAAMRFLRAFLELAPPSERLKFVGIHLARSLPVWSRSKDERRWVRVAAIELCATIFPDDVDEMIAEILRDRSGKDGMVIRRNALRVLGGCPSTRILEIASLVRDDPSEHVRQELARLLSRGGDADCVAMLVSLIREDDSPRVRGVALLELAKVAISVPFARADVLTAIEWATTQIAVPVLVKVVFAAIRSLVDQPVPAISPSAFLPSLKAIAERDDAPAEMAATAVATLRWLEVKADPTLSVLHDRFVAAIAPLLEGQSAVVVLPRDITDVQIERALAVAAHGDMTVSLRVTPAGSLIVTRGEPRAFRLWRALHEAFSPMPDKRKGYLHSHARVRSGDLVIAPVGMAEVTPTRVHGERQLYTSLGGWGPFLPRVDDLLAVCTMRERPLRIVSDFGVLTLHGPPTMGARLRARALLARRYVKLAILRERSLAATEDTERRRYAETLAAMGFRIDLGEPSGDVNGTPFTIRSPLPRAFFPATTPLGAAIPTWAESVAEYSLSPARNTPIEAAIVAWVILSAIVFRSAWIMRGIERARRDIPLSIGGWGTRGKSGTERLKAALFHALRYDVVVKTTGCEAMFIHAQRDLPAGEIFIYRPYDKATIWEQRNVLHVGRKLKTQVFLWECMALQPRFVETLIHEWMKDEVTTLTNAYPDHEDIQGPGGEDVARVIGKFMPIGGTTFTTEEQMLPLLQDAARQSGTKLMSVPTLDADLLPADLLARLPYQEHPRNVSLVLALGEHFGVDRELALVEIADKVIADLGVLKTYPEVEHRARRLSFSNGMSANERAGFLSNWVRLGFDKIDVDQNADTCVALVVNNRADRVARSRVFAQIIVDDAPADHVILINSNLGGMLQFITEALDLKLKDMRVSGDGGSARAVQRFDDAMRWLKVPCTDESLLSRIRAMISAVSSAKTADALLADDEIKTAIRDLSASTSALVESRLGAVQPQVSAPLRADLTRHLDRVLSRSRTARAARAEIEPAFALKAEAVADAAFRKAYRELFLDRIAVLWDSGATGDQVIDFVANEIPPGQRARVMGAQNIKGTGLDFVYRWLSIDRVRQTLESLKEEPATRGEQLAWLGSYGDFGLIDVREALRDLKAIRDAAAPEWALHRSMLEGVIERLQGLEKAKEARLTSSGKAALWERALGQVEALVDHLDSVRRTARAAAVMEDLFARRVGHGRAAILLRDVTYRQKGGWLAKDVKKFFSRA